MKDISPLWVGSEVAAAACCEGTAEEEGWGGLRETKRLYEALTMVIGNPTLQGSLLTYLAWCP